MTANDNDNTPNWVLSRELIVRGLRELAEYIEATPELPLPNIIDINHSVICDTDEEERAEVDRIAAILGVPAEGRFNGRHYTATGHFGPVTYRAISITEEEMERYRATLDQIDVVAGESWPI